MSDFMVKVRQVALQNLRRDLNEAWERARTAEQEVKELRALLAEAEQALGHILAVYSNSLVSTRAGVLPNNFARYIDLLTRLKAATQANPADLTRR